MVLYALRIAEHIVAGLVDAFGSDQDLFLDSYSLKCGGLLQSLLQILTHFL
jgi:hypothetical protein